MRLIEELKNLSKKISEYSGQDLSEADTETFCFEPFIKLLGFEPNPSDMQKQYPADISGGNRTADYAIKKDGVPIMIVECKPLGDGLDAHFEQLKGYFSAVSGARFGVLTNGRLYRFYTDLDESNLMDSDPFLEIDLFDIKPVLVDELERFTKSRFDVDKALTAAHNLKYSKAIRQFLMELLESPTADFITYVASEVNITINTSDQKQQVTEIVQRVLKEFKGEADSEFNLPSDDSSDNSDSISAPELYLEYWTEMKSNFGSDLIASGIRFREPQSQCWMGFAVGRTGFGIHTWVSKEEKYICVGLTVDGEHGKTHFNLLQESMTEIEKKMSVDLEWQENPKENYIRLYQRNINLENQLDWGRQHKWLCEQLKIFYKVFKPRINTLKKKK